MTTPLFVWPRLTDWPTHTAPLVYLDLKQLVMWFQLALVWSTNSKPLILNG